MQEDILAPMIKDNNKRKCEDTSAEDRGRKILKEGTKASILVKLPNEILGKVLNNINKEDLISLSSVNKEFRNYFKMIIFKEIKIKWKEIDNFCEVFKNIEDVYKIRIICDLQNEKETNNGEWNVSFKKLFERCLNLRGLEIGLLNSSRCLKYKEDFENKFSSKIKEMKLVSYLQLNDYLNNGDFNNKGLFELTQLKKFKEIEKISLNGFSICKDEYFYPKNDSINNSTIEDFEEIINEGKLVKLKEIELINCAWIYPTSLKDVFSPEYQLPSIFNNNAFNKYKINCQPSKIRLVFDKRHSNFCSSERFKSFIDNEYNEKFEYEFEFFIKLRELEIIIEDKEENEDERIIGYKPWIDNINFNRKFTVIEEEDGLKPVVKQQSIIGNLRRLTLIGWRSSGPLAWRKLIENGIKLEEIGVEVAQVKEISGAAPLFAVEKRIRGIK